MNLPVFQKTTAQTELIENEIRTAHFIGALWAAADEAQRRAPGFITLLVQCGWTNVRKDGSGRSATRTWRNRNLANYLDVQYQ